MTLFKDKKTTIAGIIGAVLILMTVIAVLTNKATLNEDMMFLGGIGAFLGTIVAFLSRDSKRENEIETMNREEDKVESIELVELELGEGQKLEFTAGDTVTTEVPVNTISKVYIRMQSGLQYIAIPGRGLKEPPPEDED